MKVNTECNKNIYIDRKVNACNKKNKIFYGNKNIKFTKFLLHRVSFSCQRLFVVFFLLIAGGSAVQNLGFKNAPIFNRKTIRQGAVASNGKECAEMGAAILKQRGSVADAAVTTLLCEGITCKNASCVANTLFWCS